MDDALKRLDKLTHEARMAVTQILKATHAVNDGVRGVMDKVLDVGQAVEVSLHNQSGQKKDILPRSFIQIQRCEDGEMKTRSW